MDTRFEQNYIYIIDKHADMFATRISEITNVGTRVFNYLFFTKNEYLPMYYFNGIRYSHCCRRNNVAICIIISNVHFKCLGNELWTAHKMHNDCKYI